MLPVTEFTKIKTQMDELKNRRKAAVSDHFKQMCKWVFEKNPKLQCFSWRQYTMAFNDGQPCYFSAYTEDLNLNDECFGDLDEFEENPEGLTDTEREQAYKDLDMLFNTLDSSDLEHLFGDPSTVVVHREGEIEIDTYYQ